MKRKYTCVIEHSGGYGGTYYEDFNYTSEYRAGSKANALDATTQWHRLHKGTARVVNGTTFLVKDRKGLK